MWNYRAHSLGCLPTSAHEHAGRWCAQPCRFCIMMYFWIFLECDCRLPFGFEGFANLPMEWERNQAFLWNSARGWLPLLRKHFFQSAEKSNVNYQKLARICVARHLKRISRSLRHLWDRQQTGFRWWLQLFLFATKSWRALRIILWSVAQIWVHLRHNFHSNC